MTEKSRVHRFVSKDLTVRAAAVDATAVVREMQSLQNTHPLATLGVGRAMVGALLMASQLKEKQQVGLLFKGNGPLKSLYAEATFEGEVRGYCPYPDYLANNEADVLNLGKALGFGQLTVARHQPFQRQPFQGTVEMVTGEIGDDIAHYLHQSHQIRSIVSVGVYLDAQGLVKSAGGILIEVMPGVEDEVADQLQRNAQGPATAVSQRLFDGANCQDLIRPFFDGIPFSEVPHEHEVRYFCPCTYDRVRRALTTLGPSELQQMIDEDHSSKITCQVCGRGYEISVDDLREIRDDLRKNSMH
ncbi:MAG: Hsp33 family molecular chaperone HslO [Bdellovibrionaceae bacterium]|nr:Hsp33 family molecular chaperone HslO [Pseudobdellovibrionaceae bacterium]